MKMRFATEEERSHIAAAAETVREFLYGLYMHDMRYAAYTILYVLADLTVNMSPADRLEENTTLMKEHLDAQIAMIQKGNKDGSANNH